MTEAASIEDQMKAAVAAADAEKDAKIAALEEAAAGADAVIEGLKADVARLGAAYERALEAAAGVAVSEIEAVVAHAEADVIGRAHSTFEKLKALIS